MLPCLDPDATYPVRVTLEDGTDTGLDLNCRYLSVGKTMAYGRAVDELRQTKDTEIERWYDAVFETMAIAVKDATYDGERRPLEWVRSDGLSPYQAYQALLYVMGRQLESEIETGKSLLPRASGTTRGSASSAEGQADA